MIIFHTVGIFKDKDGNKTTLTGAHSVEETFHSFEVTTINGQSAIYFKTKY